MEKIEVDELDVSKLAFSSEPMQCGKIVSSLNLFKNLTVKKVISNLSLDIYNGDRIAFVGKNGCGKTTLTKNYKWRNRF